MLYIGVITHLLTIYKPKDMGVNPKIGGWKAPKMDGENFMENPMNKWDDLGGFLPLFLEGHPYYRFF